MEMVLVEEISWKTCSIGTYPIDLDITPETESEDLREIGAIGSLLVELVREHSGLTGRITVEESPDGVRVRIEPNDQNIMAFSQIGGV
jgi:hypothetical protein